MQYEGQIHALATTITSQQKPHTTEYSDNIMVTNIPLFGRIHFVRDKNGIMCLTFTFLYWVYGTWCGLFVVLLPHYRDGQASGAVVSLYMLCSVMCVISLFKAATLNPGRVPLVSEISGLDTSEWETCIKCQKKRPKRAHHCSRCQQCVLRMDHHCPWINNCVGEENHYAFLQLLFWAMCLSGAAFLILQLHFWYYPPCVTCDKTVFHIKHGIWFQYLCVVMATAMAYFMGANLIDQHHYLVRDTFIGRHELWYKYLLVLLSIFMGTMMLFQLIGQHFMLLIDRTTLENMKEPRPDPDKLNIRSELAAYKEICGQGYPGFWLFPCRSRKAIRPSFYYTHNPI